MSLRLGWTRSRGLLLIGALVLLPACTSPRVFVASDYREWETLEFPGESDLHYRVYLIGDAGGASSDVTSFLGSKLRNENEASAVVFLGDNIYPAGLPDSADVNRAQAEERIGHQLAAVSDFPGRVFFIPGNHDWDDAGGDGQAAVRRLETYVENALDRGNVWIPDDGFPGPVEVELTDRITLVGMDTQWWMTRGDRPFGDTGTYELDEPLDVFIELDDILRRNDDEDILIAAHHPIFSVGRHAGRMPLKSHLFPLTDLSPALYVPMPILGSAYPFFVRFFGGAQDLANKRYKEYRRTVAGLLARDQELNVIYASGHDHTLQWFAEPFSKHYIVSGAGYEAQHVARGGGADFASKRRGFARLSYFENGEIWLDFWSPDVDRDDGLLFRTRLRGEVSEFVDPQITEPAELPDYADSTVTVAANPDYQAGSLKRFFLGRHHRDAWETPIEVPVLDLGKKKGGLKPVKRGGGMQTMSLRLEDENGREYVLRSIDKDPTKTIPEQFQGTMVVDIIQDQIAALHPYGAFIIPKLAHAAGVYHTNPELVYVPDDPRLGIYREEFGNRLMMFEDRPDDDMSHEPSYGRAPEVVSSSKLYREINDDNDHRVDQYAYVRARLFDILLSDWDRHEDQWRWAEFEPPDGTGKIYRPIPRDRDWAFNLMDGLLMRVYRLIDARFQSFGPDYGYLLGYTINGGSQDRRFTNELTKEDWLAAARHIRNNLTEAVIDSAIADWPDAIVELDGSRFKEVLQQRLDQLVDVAGEMYDLYASVVDLVGSHKHERFLVERLNDEETRIRILKTSKEGEVRKQLYERVFLHSETEEVRLFGLDGNDHFEVSGTVASGLKVLAVGGAGHDTFVDNSSVMSSRYMTHFYDSKTGNEWDVASGTRVTKSDNPAANAYDPDDYRPNQRLPKPWDPLESTCRHASLSIL